MGSEMCIRDSSKTPMEDKWKAYLLGKKEMVEKNIEKYSRTLAEKRELDKTAKEKYFTKTSTGWESIQYDQGEDRWLCTLLIIRGWEVLQMINCVLYHFAVDSCILSGGVCGLKP